MEISTFYFPLLVKSVKLPPSRQMSSFPIDVTIQFINLLNQMDRVWINSLENHSKVALYLTPLASTTVLHSSVDSWFILYEGGRPSKSCPKQRDIIYFTSNTVSRARNRHLGAQKFKFMMNIFVAKGVENTLSIVTWNLEFGSPSFPIQNVISGCTSKAEIHSVFIRGLRSHQRT